MEKYSEVIMGCVWVCFNAPDLKKNIQTYNVLSANMYGNLFLNTLV